jgi:DNA-binding NarL/FixJ family response regulator
MRPSSVVVLEQDASIAGVLVPSLKNHFETVRVANSPSDLRDEVAKRRATLVVLDLENAGLAEIRQLREDFPQTSIVCTHRLADEQMWAEVLAAGAADLCDASDFGSIIRSAVIQSKSVQSAAAGNCRSSGLGNLCATPLL